MADPRLEDGTPAKFEEDALDAVRSGRLALALEAVPSTLRPADMYLEALCREGRAFCWDPKPSAPVDSAPWSFGRGKVGVALDRVP